MSLEPLPPLDVRPLFAPLFEELLGVLSGLKAEEWERPASRAWKVRDVAAHLLDGDCRQLAFSRDRMPVPPPERPIEGPQDFLAFLDGLNATWVRAAQRLSPRLLVDLLRLTGREVAEHFATLDPEDEAVFGVAWAGEERSLNWMHLARELTERFHHQQQIREATGRPLLDDPRFAAPVLEAFLYGLPPAYEGVEADPGAVLEVAFSAPVDRRFAVVFDPERGWRLGRAESGVAPARVELDPVSAWRTLTRSWPVEEAKRHAKLSGPAALVEPFFQACSIHKRPVAG